MALIPSPPRLRRTLSVRHLAALTLAALSSRLCPKICFQPHLVGRATHHALWKAAVPTRVANRAAVPANGRFSLSVTRSAGRGCIDTPLSRAQDTPSQIPLRHDNPARTSPIRYVDSDATRAHKSPTLADLHHEAWPQVTESLCLRLHQHAVGNTTASLPTPNRS